MMKFTVNNKRAVQPVPTTAPVSRTTHNGVGSMFKNMMEGKYKSKGCSSCSGAR